MRAQVKALAVVVGLVAAGLLITIGNAPAKAPPSGPVAARPAKPSDLTVERAQGVTLTSGDEAVWSFGRRKAAPGDTIEHIFTFRNVSGKAISIDSLLTSCHCTTANLLRTGTARVMDLPFTLPPGKSVNLEVSINVDQAHAVDFRKMVWVYAAGKDDAAFTLTVAGTLISSTDQ